MLPSADAFIGQPLARRLLDGYLRLGRVSGTFLLLGQQGLGKTTLGAVFARAIVCERNAAAPRLWFCGECYACRSIATGNQPEYVVVRPSGKQISVEQVEDDHGGFHSAALHPTLLSHRVFVIDDAHYLNEFTANQMLKLLEEAPARTVFILVSDKPELMLPTILSRSHRISLTPLPEDELAAVLSRGGQPAADAQAAARMAAGRYVDAQLLLADPGWRDAVSRLAGALAQGRGSVEAAQHAAQFEFDTLWAKEARALGIEPKEAEKLIERTRRNELQRQALLTAYERAAWTLRRSISPELAAALPSALSALNRRINQNVDPLLCQVAFEQALRN